VFWFGLVLTRKGIRNKKTTTTLLPYCVALNLFSQMYFPVFSSYQGISTRTHLREPITPNIAGADLLSMDTEAGR
jgi:hypothetical protein